MMKDSPALRPVAEVLHARHDLNDSRPLKGYNRCDCIEVARECIDAVFDTMAAAARRESGAIDTVPTVDYGGDMTTTQYLTPAQYRADKARLTRAVNSGHPDRVIACVDLTFALWDAGDFAYPDGWHRWQRAADDARHALRVAAW